MGSCDGLGDVSSQVSYHSLSELKFDKFLELEAIFKILSPEHYLHF